MTTPSPSTTLGAIIERSPGNAAPPHGLRVIAWIWVTVQQTARHAKCVKGRVFWRVSAVQARRAGRKSAEAQPIVAPTRGGAARRAKSPGAAQKIHGCQDSERLFYDFRANAWAIMH